MAADAPPLPTCANCPVPLSPAAIREERTLCRVCQQVCDAARQYWARFDNEEEGDLPDGEY